jgi:hypothetical protein
MALNPKTSATYRNAALDAGNALLNGGKFRWYDSTQPTDADTALGAQVLLADLALNATFAGAASAGSATANSITADTSADATGTCTWCSLLTSGNARRIDGSAGTSSANLVLNTTSIVSGANCSCSSLTVSMAA